MIWFVLILLGSFFVIGFGLLGSGLWNAWRSIRAGAWPTAPGVVTQVSLKEGLDDDGHAEYQVDVKYAYTVNGVA
jgi:hypothetical protein